MKNKLFTLVVSLFSICLGIYAQETTESADTAQPLEFIIEQKEVVEQESGEEAGVWFAEENAKFKGGDIANFNTWVGEHVQYPMKAAKEGISGKVIVQFSVNRVGKVCDIKVIRRVDPLLDVEAIRVIKSSPDWEPAKQSGKAVKQNFTIPIFFNLN